MYSKKFLSYKLVLPSLGDFSGGHCPEHRLDLGLGLGLGLGLDHCLDHCFDAGTVPLGAGL
ncbi:hypothetical protein [Paeniglutamicibacter terrestris]|uniref:Uncharacterized protein n=1 Tax=Paeniglutamicibacter terrestris TaxID=2723403 RepID=A0ABX1G489_9MICC|nr:hypothetical protein [Paeniglutamicibacter terrestris]NKG20566.1 hypothetical protein [Paeniglutamicibacter terrestris]